MSLTGTARWNGGREPTAAMGSTVVRRNSTVPKLSDCFADGFDPLNRDGVEDELQVSGAGVGHCAQVRWEVGHENGSDGAVVVGFSHQPPKPVRQLHQHRCCRLDLARRAACLFYGFDNSAT